MDNQAQPSLQPVFLPEFCSGRGLLLLLLFAEVVALLLTLAAMPSPHNGFWVALGLRLLFVSWVVLSSAGILCVINPWLGKQGNTRAGMVAFLVIQLMTVCMSTLAVVAMEVGEPAFGFQLRNLGISSIIALTVLRFMYLQFQAQQRQLASSAARFQALQARIRPHFLFNSLNTVITLIPEDPVRAENTLTDLADLFRASLSDAQKPVTLKQELVLVNQYLRIEQYRLGERLRVEWDMDPLPLDLRIPSLLIQPLVENAVYHGIALLDTGGAVRIRGWIRRGRVMLQISNPMPHRRKQGHAGNRMALENIRHRVRHAFGEQGKVLVSSADHVFRVTLIFPLRWEVAAQ